MKKAPGGASSGKLAEEEGFEPSLPGLRVKRFSRPPHSTTLPPLRFGVRGLAPYETRLRGAGISWRRDRDSNPRYAFGAHTISNRAPSASRSSLRSSETCMLALGADVQQLRSIQQLIRRSQARNRHPPASSTFSSRTRAGDRTVRRVRHAQGNAEQRAHSIVGEQRNKCSFGPSAARDVEQLAHHATPRPVANTAPSFTSTTRLISGMMSSG